MAISYGERIKMYRKHANLTQKELAEKLGIDHTAISNWERDIYKYDIEMLVPLSKALGVSPTDLLGFYTDFSLSPDEEQLIKTYRNLEDTDKETLMKLGEALNVLKDSIKKTADKVKTFISHPVFLIPASAGTGQFLDSDEYELIDFPEEAVPRDSNFAVRVSGDSMEPDYPDESIVFIKQVKSIEPGEVGIFIVNNEGFLKQLGDSDNLVSINPNYEDIQIQQFDECRLVGKVVGVYNE